MKSVLLDKVKSAVQQIEPSAEIILYGSRAREDFHESSDWDLLILVDGVVNDKRTDIIRHQLYEIEWETGDVLCSIVRSRTEWESPEYRIIPLYKNIKLEGISI
jgi:predicted nucleotidyltransferase